MKRDIYHRAVGFGTRFVQRDGNRPVLATADGDKPESLFSNELAVDVGGDCLGHRESDLMVFDHHFTRDDLAQTDGKGRVRKLGDEGVLNFPSAAMAVLFQARRIATWAANLVHGEAIWLVTHRDPDFDAYCACYLARRLIEDPGLAEAFTNSGRLDKTDEFATFWRSTRRVTQSHAGHPHCRVLFLMAAYAARVDQCVPDACSRESSLRFLFLAAQERGRFAAPESSTMELLPDGSRFFRDIETAILEEGYNPLLDELPESLARSYGPEVGFIRSQANLYKMDMRRAEILPVSVARSRSSFREWSARIRGDQQTSGSGIPLWLVRDGKARLSPFFETLSGGGAEAVGITPEHLGLAKDNILHERVPEDGLLIEDPKCLFFKDWVRSDLDNSPNRKGFTFTGIKRCDLGGKPRYWISLDTEKAAPSRMHLYDLWTMLQEREGYARTLRPKSDSQEPRNDILARDELGKEGLFDPWYDGNAYSGTILDTPNRGVQPSERGQDDPIFKLVRQWMARGFYNPAARPERISFSIQSEHISIHPERRSIVAPERFEADKFREEAHKSLKNDCLHLGLLDLNRSLKINDKQSGPISAQIGHDLWRLISPYQQGLPPDFEENHLLSDQNWIAVWHRHGIAVAMVRNPGAFDLESQLKESLQSLAEVMRIIEQEPKSGEIESWLARVRTAQQNLIQIEAANVRGQNRILRRFLEAVNLSEISARVADLAESYRDEEEADRERLIGDVLAVASIAGLVLAYFQVEGVKWFGDAPEKRVKVYTAAGIGVAILLGLYLFSRKNIW
jgi:hypothetical protein